MEIVTEEPLKILSQLLIPIIVVIVTGFVQVIFKTYLSLREKNKYIELLKANFPSVEEFLDRIKTYKIITVYFSSYVYFIVGVLAGFLIELILVPVIAYIFEYILDINYIGNLLDLSSDVVILNVVALIYSCSNSGILIALLFFISWCKYLGSKRLFTPKISEYGEVETSFVYQSFWVFIGTVFGLYIAMFVYFTATLYNLSIIDNNLSFNRVRFDLIYTHLLYPGVHVIAYMLGFSVGLVLIVASYFFAKWFNESVIRSITNLYKYDFPYVKIKTENGEVKGQFRGILDKYLVTLSENNILKIVRWDKIETMEIIPRNKKEPYIFNEVFKK
ncbi:hypothetical protein RSJ42_07150 [Methanosarcina hadiensis]|uniref:hypothetical protein n=1 Tax=Methanosarcina hadiensis TaxID=3078083 RepID=UPI0039773AEA